ncbi:hypothetical protein [Phenylobacterium sp.]|uniref:hypothetical protein n=1 Tax=Phenylobacterium sp. TaxID=1871053 RepID=UPI0028113EF1|nr:hypothetical protein [Phenylobacterium sp.]
MTKEHIWPRWIIERANAGGDQFKWIGGSRATPNKAVVPLCYDCNQRLGTELEGPVSEAFRDVEAGHGLSGRQCALLVKWLWKFEGLFWCWEHPHGRYSDLWSVTERTTQDAAIESIADGLSLGIGLIHANEREDVWPVGVDTPLGEQGVCVAGVFSRVAIAVSYSDLTGVFVGGLDFQPLSRDFIRSDEKSFFPATRFPTSGAAIDFMKTAGPIAADLHERAMLSARTHRFIHPAPRRRVELPH